jgi:hypothetical protein
MSELSESPQGWSSRWERASGFPDWVLEWCWRVKLNRERKIFQQACLQFSFWVDRKYWRFWWSMRISIVCGEPSK